MDFIQKVQLFNEIAGTKNVYDTRKTALYIGLILEEVGEALDAIGMNDCQLSYELGIYSQSFKEGKFDLYIENKLESKDSRVELLDAFVDIAVVSLGGAHALGADVQGACHAVANNNLEKFPVVDGVHTVLRDANGKVKKPDGYVSVKLNDFV